MILNPTVMGGGVDLPQLDNPGTEEDLLFGKQLIDAAGNVVMGMMPLVQQATPSISVSSTGLITASATQEAGKVEAGTESATRQLTTQGAQTITPGTANKTIPSGRYLTGTQTIQGDANLVAANIKSGVSIFGVQGSYAGDGYVKCNSLSNGISIPSGGSSGTGVIVAQNASSGYIDFLFFRGSYTWTHLSGRGIWEIDSRQNSNASEKVFSFYSIGSGQSYSFYIEVASNPAISTLNFDPSANYYGSVIPIS